MPPPPPAHPPAGEPWARWRISVAEIGAAQPLCVALANTRERRDGARPVERLVSVDDLLRFAREHAVCDEVSASLAAARAAAHPRAALAELAATIALREAIVRLLTASAHPATEDLALVTQSFDAAHRAITVELRARALAARPRRGDAGLAAVRLQAAVSALVLLASPQAERVRRCADDRGCGRLFVDTTRNGSRRYCLAGECGNRARQTAFRARHRALRV